MTGINFHDDVDYDDNILHGTGETRDSSGKSGTWRKSSKSKKGRCRLSVADMEQGEDLGSNSNSQSLPSTPKRKFFSLEFR